ncbi:MAG: heavy-metal-associated domain-containing protein [Bacilli bacterium]|nr:heavy-metal-associated domain-containing protein [Bacilli bacterium]MBN2876887.1 heavy-metal-associated domain-containing protein [Bacilli bacterium]
MKFLVDNMTCKHCVMHITNALKQAGFKKFDIDLPTQTVTLKLGKLTSDDAKKAVEGIDYHFQLMEE